MATWPVTLPQRLSIQGFSESLADNALVTEMDEGPPKRRRRSTASTRPLAGSMIMTTAQWEALVTFFTTTIEEVLPFDFPKPSYEDSQTLSVCFVSPPSRVFSSPGRWRVSLNLEVQI